MFSTTSAIILAIAGVVILGSGNKNQEPITTITFKEWSEGK